MASVLPAAGAAELRRLASALADRLPDSVRPLAEVAYDYHWSWMRDGSAVFREIDPHRWRLSGQNPVRFLSDLSHDAVASVEARPQLLERIRALADEHAAYASTAARNGDERPVVFLCAEFGVHVSIQIYSGGLGVLAGDFLKEASDRGFPLVGVGLLYRRGYFHQRLDTGGRQQEYWAELDPETLPMALVEGPGGDPLRLEVTLYGKPVAFHVWRVDVGRVPLFLLDAELPENHAVQRWTTARLYDGNPTVRLAQYGLLGIGAVRLLDALGLEPRVIHLNEGHPALAPLELAAEDVARGTPLEDALAAARRRVVFTTHTPIPAGNETYPADVFLDAYGDLAGRLGASVEEFLSLCRADPDGGGEPGMSALAIRMSRTRNGVSELHGAVARRMWQPMFPEAGPDDVPITHVTNGAHVPTFTAQPMAELLARHLGEGWTERAGDAELWQRVYEIPNEELWEARAAARGQLVRFTLAKSQSDRLLRGEQIDYVLALQRTFSADVLTLGFARRLATYKRLYLLTHDLDRVASILGGPNPVQLLIAGKAHPNDEAGKETLQRLFRLRRQNGDVGARVSFLEDYDLEVAQQLVSGCDVWVNLPKRPLEASGTSGMKATFNGALQLSVLDGWWAEAYDGTNGWGIPGDEDPDPAVVDERDATCFYDLLEHEVIPEFYDRDEAGVPHRWCERIKRALVTCVPRFTAARMLDEYETRIYGSE